MSEETYQCHGPMQMASDGKFHAIVSAADIIRDNGLWRIFPIINVDQVQDIPIDYPGPMGVPITVAGKKIGGLKIIGSARPQINGKAKYQRLIVRNLHPAIPTKVDIADWLTNTGFRITSAEFHNGHVYLTFADETKTVTLKHKIEGAGTDD